MGRNDEHRRRRRRRILNKRQVLAPQIQSQLSIQEKNKKATTEGLLETGPPLDLHLDLPYPDHFQETYVVTLSSRPGRYGGMEARMGPWSKYLTRVEGTDGSKIDKARWVRVKKCRPGTRLRRGELGCYDSHMRIWKDMIDRGVECAFIMEDDANVRYTHDHWIRMTSVLEEADTHIPDWDILYFGSNAQQRTQGVRGTKNLGTCRGCQGLYAYVLKLSGAKKLLRGALPMRYAVDVYTGKMGNEKKIKPACMIPRLCWVVPVHSDTCGIV